MPTERDANAGMRAAFAAYLLLHGQSDVLAPFPVGQLNDLWGLWEAAWLGGTAQAGAAAIGPSDGALASLLVQEVRALRDRPDPNPISLRVGAGDKDVIEQCHERTGYSRNEVMRLLLRIGMRYADQIPPKPHWAMVLRAREERQQEETPDGR